MSETEFATELATETTVCQLIYASAATVDFSDEELSELLDKARVNNKRLGVSGMLLYHEGSFLQALEGDEDVVMALYDKISQDKRHRSSKLVWKGEVSSRTFEDWTMGFHAATKDSVKRIDGYSNLMSASDSKLDFWEQNPSKARQVLAQFVEGRWRQDVES